MKYQRFKLLPAHLLHIQPFSGLLAFYLQPYFLQKNIIRVQSNYHVAYGTKRTILYYTKAITILVVSLITYLIFVATFFVIEIIQSGYIPTASEVINLLGWALACGTVLLALESISIFLCVVIQNTGIVTGICCLYVFSGASVYLMLWSDMETVSIPLKFFVYGNPMYYWMNFSSCRTMGIIEHLPFYFIGCISLLIVGGLIMIRKEIK